MRHRPVRPEPGPGEALTSRLGRLASDRRAQAGLPWPALDVGGSDVAAGVVAALSPGDGVACRTRAGLELDRVSEGYQPRPVDQ